MRQQIRINDVYIPLLTNTSRYLVQKGGAGSGKSVFAAQKIVLRTLTEKKHRFLVIRKVAATRQQSVFKLLKTIIDEFGVLNEFEINKTDLSFLHKPTGNEILTAGIDDSEKLKSIAGITGIWVEEATELNEDDFDQIDLRLRGETINYKQIILTFNPIDERHWLKKRFEDNQSENTYLLKTTYEHNHFIDEEYKFVLDTKAAVNPNFFRIYKLGEWGKPDVQRPYCYNFDHNKHVSEIAQFSIHKRVYLSFDFNVEPFVCTARHQWFDKEGHHWHVFKQFVMNNGDVYKMAQALKDFFPKDILASAVFTGDAMQRKREITQRDNIDGWRILAKELNITSARLQVPRANPSVKENRHLVNSILALHPDYKINPVQCPLLVNEMQFTEADEEGDIIKKTRAKETQRADALDSERYAQNSWMPDFIDNPRKYGVK